MVDFKPKMVIKKSPFLANGKGEKDRRLGFCVFEFEKF